MQITHPINDPSLISFHDPALVKLLPGLEVAMDCWNLMNTETRGSAKSKYLHKEQGESKTAYMTRLSRATYTPIYRDSIKAYAGLLSRFQLVDPPASLLQYEQDVDLQGSSIQAFWNRADELAIRDKYDDRDGVDHSHYGDDVLRALSHYSSCRLAYEKLGKFKFKIENTDRLDAVQNAFDALVKARKRETGHGYYLTKQQYNQLKD